MITRYQNFRYLPSPEFRGPRVVWILHQLPFGRGIRKRISQNRFFFTHHSGNVSRHCVDNNESGDFASRKDEIANRDFRGRQVFDDPLIDPFVAATDERQARCPRAHRPTPTS